MLEQWIKENAKIRENGKIAVVNYRCIPESSQCKNMFCLVLSHTNGMVHIKEGYLEEV